MPRTCRENQLTSSRVVPGGVYAVRRAGAAVASQRTCPRGGGEVGVLGSGRQEGQRSGPQEGSAVQGHRASGMCGSAKERKKRVRHARDAH